MPLQWQPDSASPESLNATRAVGRQPLAPSALRIIISPVNCVAVAGMAMSWAAKVPSGARHCHDCAAAPEHELVSSAHRAISGPATSVRRRRRPAVKGAFPVILIPPDGPPQRYQPWVKSL